MSNVMKATWDDIASRWDDWGPPLRPCAEDLSITRSLLQRWRSDDTAAKQNPGAKVRVFLCGVTPEIAAMDWPFPIDLLGMDRAETMVQKVWPGDVPGVRRAVVGNWTQSGLDAGSRDLIVGDGGFGFFQPPDAAHALAAELRRLMRPGGLFLYRHYAQAAKREKLSGVFDALRAGKIGNFHVFKWRLAMALQPSGHDGVVLKDIWQAWTDVKIDTAKLPQPGFSERAVSTIHFYHGKEARLHFATAEEFKAILSGVFKEVRLEFPKYELGERCPFFTARA